MESGFAEVMKQGTPLGPESLLCGSPGRPMGDLADGGELTA